MIIHCIPQKKILNKWSKMTVKELATELELSVRQTNRCLNKYEKLGYIEREQRCKNPFNHTNSWRLLNENGLKKMKYGNKLIECFKKHQNKYEPGFMFKRTKYYPRSEIKAKVLKSKKDKLKAKCLDGTINNINIINILNTSVNNKKNKTTVKSEATDAKGVNLEDTKQLKVRPSVDTGGVEANTNNNSNDFREAISNNQQKKQLNKGQQRVRTTVKIFNEVFPELKGHYDLRDTLQFDDRQCSIGTSLGRTSLKCNDDEYKLRKFFLKARAKLLPKLLKKISYKYIKNILSTMLCFTFIDTTLASISKEKTEEFRAAYYKSTKYQKQSLLNTSPQNTPATSYPTQPTKPDNIKQLEQSNQLNQEVINKVIKAVGKDNYEAWFKNKNCVKLYLRENKCICQITQEGFIFDIIKIRFSDALKSNGIEMITPQDFRSYQEQIRRHQEQIRRHQEQIRRHQDCNNDHCANEEPKNFGKILKDILGKYLLKLKK